MQVNHYISNFEYSDFKKALDEFKKKVSIIQIVEDLGYQLDKKEGLKTPCYKLYAGDTKIDTVIINNPNTNENQYYFSRQTNEKGDVISFVKNNIDRWNVDSNKSLWANIYDVLANYANMPSLEQNMESQYKQSAKKEYKEFDINNYKVVDNPKIEYLGYLTNNRAISQDVIKDFLPFIKQVAVQYKGNTFYNVCFPYVTPGEDKITNLEIRNTNFKGMATGGNKRDSVWMATSGVPQMVKQVYLFESAIDALSFYELNKSKVPLKECAFVSIGGYLSTNQVKNVINHFPNAQINCCFDNDINGRIYAIKTLGIANGCELDVVKYKDNRLNIADKTGEKKMCEGLVFEMSDLAKELDFTKKVREYKCNGEFKDWNEQLCSLKKNEQQQTNSRKI